MEEFDEIFEPYRSQTRDHTNKDAQHAYLDSTFYLGFLERKDLFISRLVRLALVIHGKLPHQGCFHFSISLTK